MPALKYRDPYTGEWKLVPVPGLVSNLLDATALGKAFLKTSTDPTAARGVINAEAKITPSDATKYYAGDKTWKTLDKNAVGLDSVDNSGDQYKWVKAADQLSSNYKINGIPFNATQDITIPTPESVLPRTWHDILAFGTINGWPTFETRTGTTWTVAGLGKEIFDGKDSTYIDVIPESGSINGCRYTWNSAMLPWSQWEHLVLILNNSGGAARSLKYTIQHSDDGSVWSDFGTLTSPDWSVTLDIPTSWAWGGWQYMRILVERESGTGGLRLTNMAAYTRRMGDQGGGRETEFPYDWNSDKVISFAANPLLPSAPTVAGHATRKDYVDAQVKGRVFISNASTPDPANVTNPKDGDAFVYTNSGDVFRYSGSAWAYEASLVSTALAAKAPVASPNLTGTPKVNSQAIATIAGGANAAAVKDVSGGTGLWIGAVASLPGTGTTGVLYVTY